MSDNNTMGQGVLDQNHLDQINEAIRQGKEAQRQIDLARQAGIDVTVQQEQLNANMAQLRQLKQVYFPGQV